MKIEIHPAAQAELSDASTYYETTVPGLGEDFLDEFHGTIERIARHSKIGVLVEAPHRRVILNRFPYSVYYRVIGSTLRITAVSHQHRKPGYWVTRR